jgi:hypothetical protein
MTTNANKKPVNRNRVAKAPTSREQRDSKAASSIVDNRPEAKILAGLQEMADNSPQAASIQRLKTMAGNSSQAAAQRSPDRVRPTLGEKVRPINGGLSLERESDVVGETANKAVATTDVKERPEVGQTKETRQLKPVIQRAYYYWDYASDAFLYSYGLAFLTPGIRRYQDAADNNIAHGGHAQTWITNAGWANVQRDRQEDAVKDAYNATGEIANPGVPAELSAGIAGLATDALKAARLFLNLNNFRFRYTGGVLNPKVAFEARQGDCQTLVGMYMLAAAEMNIPITIERRMQRQLVARQPIHGRTTQGNTEGDTDWYFHEHYWVTSNGVPYDVLFMITPPPAVTVSNGQAVHNGVTYYTFADGRCVIERGEAALNYDIQGLGRVFANAAAAILFINAHP